MPDTTHKENEQPQIDKTKRLLLIIGGVLFFTLIGSIALRLEGGSVTTDNTIVPTPTFYPPQAINKLPKDWTFQTRYLPCKVGIPIPPTKPPYYFPYDPHTVQLPTSDIGSGRFWQFQQENVGVLLFRSTLRAIFKNVSETGDYISAEVEVSCSPNQFNLTTESLTAEIKQILQSTTQNISFIDQTDGTMWNHPVKIVHFQGKFFDPQDDYYLFAIKNAIYMVHKHVESPNQSVRDTTQIIFDNLQFPMN